MLRFILISLGLHILLAAIVLGFSFYTPKPKTIQIKLASLPTPNNTKKNMPPLIDEKKAEQEKTVEVQKLLDSVLKEDIQEKVIEKAVEEAPALPKPKTSQKQEQLLKEALPSVVPTQMPPPAPKPVVPSPIAPIPKQNNAPIVSPQNNQVYPKEDSSNPYLNSVMPQESKAEVKPILPDNNPYLNPVAPTEENKKPSLPPRKTIDVSAAKDDNMSAVVSSIAEMPADILSKDNYSLSDADKKALSNQISQCLSSLGLVRENTETINLVFSMAENAKIKEINVLRGDKIVPPKELSNLENRVIYLFNNPKCATLILPQGKFTYWQKFTIKINLKGLFE
ncbi:MAG: hypothetical protein FWE18_06130 [Alphaproteobacteria bacterium]|nr:hypothetical protein [Alphaproteobacteria bacterium]